MNIFNFHLNASHDEAGKNEAPNHAGSPRIHFLLDNLQSPINIGKCARVAEIFGMGLYIHDPRNVVGKPDAFRTITDFACGAWERRASHMVNDVTDFVGNYRKGRVIATCLDTDAIRLHDFEFAEGDLIMLGNEYDGLPSGLIESADAKIYIPMPKLYLPKPCSHWPIDPARSTAANQNGVPNLNVAVAAGIVGYEFSCWLEKKGYRSQDFQETHNAESPQIAKTCC